jgi:hypothetical protein
VRADAGAPVPLGGVVLRCGGPGAATAPAGARHALHSRQAQADQQGGLLVTLLFACLQMCTRLIWWHIASACPGAVQCLSYRHGHEKMPLLAPLDRIAPCSNGCHVAAIYICIRLRRLSINCNLSAAQPMSICAPASACKRGCRGVRTARRGGWAWRSCSTRSGSTSAATRPASTGEPRPGAPSWQSQSVHVQSTAA